MFIRLLSDSLVESDITNKDKFFTIGEVAQIVGIEAKTIRYYEKAGLIQAPRASGMRVFRASDVFQLQVIRVLRALGVHVKEIKKVISETSFDNEQSLHEPSFVKIVTDQLAAQRSDLEVLRNNILFAESFLARNMLYLAGECAPLEVA